MIMTDREEKTRARTRHRERERQQDRQAESGRIITIKKENRRTISNGTSNNELMTIDRFSYSHLNYYH